MPRSSKQNLTIRCGQQNLCDIGNGRLQPMKRVWMGGKRPWPVGVAYRGVSILKHIKE